MRRVVRHLFTMASTLSLLLFVAVCVLWLRSFWIGDHWWLERHRSRDGRSTFVAAHANSTRGTMEVMIESGDANHAVGNGSTTHHSTQPPFPLIFQSLDSTLLERLGLRLDSGPAPLYRNGEEIDGTSTIINFPDCYPAMIFAVLPFLWGIGWAMGARRRRRAGAGFCSACGYDLRASPERCPECGAENIRAV